MFTITESITMENNNYGSRGKVFEIIGVLLRSNHFMKTESLRGT